MTTTLITEFSAYEVDQAEQRIRRITSTHAPTPNQGDDQIWKHYWHLSWVGKRLLIEWGIDNTNDGDVLRRTMTSEIQSVDGDTLTIPIYESVTHT